MSYYPVFEEELLLGVISGLVSGFPSMLFSVAAYVLMALALQTMAQRRGLNKPWLAWIPVVNVWLVGSLSDQYSYVVKGEIKSRRKWLLGLKIVSAALTVATVVLGIVVAFGAIHVMGYGANGREIAANIMGPALGLAGIALAMAGVSIAYAVIRYMALYDVFKSMDPNNCVVFLVLSILFHIEAFFLFFSRNKDLGMPPRRPQPTYTSQEQPQWQPRQEEPWEQEHKDYL